MDGARLYRDIDGDMKPFAALSDDGYHHNIRTGTFSEGDCRSEGHLYGRGIFRTNPPTRECLRCGARVIGADETQRPPL
jgi:hypothetical protein